MFDGISKTELSHVLIFGNSLLGLKETGIVALAAIVFTNDSRFHAFLFQSGKEEPKWTCQQYPIHIQNQSVLIPSFRGQIAKDILFTAERARQAIKTKIGRLQCEKSYKVSAEGVEEIFISQEVSDKQCQTTTSLV